MSTLEDAVASVLRRRGGLTARELLRELHSAGMNDLTKSALNRHLYGSPEMYAQATDQKKRPVWNLAGVRAGTANEATPRADPDELDPLLSRLLLAGADGLDEAWFEIHEAYPEGKLPEAWAAPIIVACMRRRDDLAVLNLHVLPQTSPENPQAAA